MSDLLRDKEAMAWAKAVKNRDNYVCQLCRAYGVPLHSHHLNSWDIFIHQRYDINNGMTLCQQCHLFFHSCYSKGSNSKFQFEEFKTSISTLKKILMIKNQIANMVKNHIIEMSRDDLI